MQNEITAPHAGLTGPDGRLCPLRALPLAGHLGRVSTSLGLLSLIGVTSYKPAERMGLLSGEFQLLQ